MPTKTWGPSVSTGSGSKLTLSYTGISVSGGTATLTSPKVEFYSRSGWSDSSNNIGVSGTAIIDDSSIHSGLLNGGTRTWNLSAQTVNLNYGSTTTATFICTVDSVNFFNGDGNEDDYSWTITFPARPYDAPSAPTELSASYIGGYRVGLSWENPASTTAAPVTKSLVQRRIDGESWSTVMSLSARESWTDTNVPLNAKLDYRVKAGNSSEWSTYSSASTAYSTAAAPTSASAQKQADNSILVSWQDNSGYETHWRIEESFDGGSTWAGGAWTITAGSSSWVHASPSLTETHTYRVQAQIAGAPYQSGWATTGTVQLAAPPAAPDNLLPSSGWIDSENDLLVSWEHVPTDSSEQTACAVRFQTSTDGTSWSSEVVSGKMLTTVESYSIADGWTPGLWVRWRVRTWGVHADPGAWSPYQTLRAAERPVASITDPSAGAYSSASLTVTVGHYDAGGYGRSQSTVWLLDGAGTLRETRVLAGATDTVTFATLITEGDWSVEATVTSATTGLRSDVDSIALVVEYLPPVAAELGGAVWDAESGAVSLDLVTPSGDGIVTDDTATIDVYRLGADGVRSVVAVGLDPSPSITDMTPTLTGEVYVVVSHSASGAVTETVLVVDPDPTLGCWFFLTTVSGLVARVRHNPQRERTVGAAQSAETVWGREFAVSRYGGALDETTGLSATLHVASDGDWAALRAVRMAREDVIARSPDGVRQRVMLTGLSVSDQNTIAQSVSLSWARVDDPDVVVV